MEFLFEWDEEKARNNLRKHRVSFEEGTTIFNDPFVATMLDPDHSDGEQRYIAIGLSARSRLLLVSYIERGESTRLIGCRKATSNERKIYEEDDF